MHRMNESDHDRYLRIEQVSYTYRKEESVNAKQIHSTATDDGSSSEQSSLREATWRARERGSGVQKGRHQLRKEQLAKARRTEEEVKARQDTKEKQRTLELGVRRKERRYPDGGTDRSL